MVTLRESPRRQHPTTEEPQWPPRSPHEALLSSPSGRKKYQRMLDRGSPSPTSRRRPKPETNDDLTALPLPSDGDEEEDEEMLQLKLQAIEARMKLKRLQVKNKRTGGSEAQDSKIAESSRPRTDTSSIRERPRTTASSSLQPPVQVPVSPIKDRRTLPEQKSPARVVLGIDKGIKASDISLKRAASTTGMSSRYEPVRKERHVSTPGLLEKESKPKSFSERISESRINEREIHEKEERIKKARNTGFGIAKARLVSNRDGQAQAPNAKNDEQPSSTKQSSAFGERRVPRSRIEPTESTLPRARKLAPVTSYSQAERNRRSASPSPSPPPRLTSLPGVHSEQTEQVSVDDKSDSETILEPYSGLYLSKRLISHDTLTRTFQGRELYSLPRLLKEVTSPHYDPPSCESDYVVLGILASKSIPRDQKPSTISISTSGDAEDKARPKFMVFRLTDFKWSIDVFLFGTGFERYWKLIPGTVIGLLNPGIMPPRNKDKGDFSLKLASCDDTVLEIGRSRDLGFCKAKKKDGNECGDWIDKRKTTVCEFHIALQVEKTKRGRMEVNGMTGLYGASGSRDGSSRRKGKDELKREGRYHDQYLHETMWIAPKEFSRSSASLIDGHDDYNAYERGMSREELLRKKKKELEKEKALAEKLTLKGHGAGSEYLKAERLDRPTSTDPTAPSSSHAQEPVDAKVLGLLSNKADDVHLSPVKGRKKTGAFIQEPMGWKGAFKRGLPSPTRDAKSERNIRSPSPKKARFMLENKGIREPGRESLGNVNNDVLLDDDDDGLDII